MTPSKINPFPGLRSFETSESHLYFSREDQVDELLRRLRKNRFLAVVGSSGSGKSSLVRAGLIPSLEGGFMTGSGSQWRIALFRPLADPIGELAKALNGDEVFGNSNSDDRSLQLGITEMVLRRAATGLRDLAAEAAMGKQENLLIIVDQFEELFRFTKSQGALKNAKDEADSFVRLLLTAVREQEYSIYVMITMRSDYLGDCAAFRELPQAMNDSQYLIPRLSRSELERAIRGPVAVSEASISDSLVNRLLNDLGDDQDQLPVLQHALMRTWDDWNERRQSNTIDLTNYDEIGTMNHALSKHATSVYEKLPTSRDKTIAAVLFKCLTDRGSDSRGIRRPTTIKEVAEIANVTETDVSRVVNQFRAPGRTFILPMPPPDDLSPATPLDLSHESLMRIWGQLGKWADEEKDSGDRYKKVADTAAAHARGEFGLYREKELSLALDWLDKQQPNPTWAERYDPKSEHQTTTRLEQVKAFLKDSKEELDKQKDKEQQKLNNLIRMKTGLGILFCMSSFAAIVTAFMYIEAQKQKALAFAISSQAQQISDPPSSVVNGLAALELRKGLLIPSIDSSLDLIDTLSAAITNNTIVDVTHSLQGSVFTLVQLKTGELISGGSDGSLKRWSMNKGKLTPVDEKLIPSGQDVVLSMVELKNGMLISSGADGSLKRWSMNKGMLTPVDEKEIATGQGPVLSMVELMNGELISGGIDGSLKQWSKDGKLVKKISTNKGPVWSLVALSNGDFAAASGKGMISRWRDGELVGDYIDTNQSSLKSMVKLKNGELVTGGLDGTIRRWHEGNPTGETINPIDDKPIQTGQSGVRGMLGMNDNMLITAGTDGSILRWKEGSPIGAATKNGQGQVLSLVQLRDGELFTGGSNGTINKTKWTNYTPVNREHNQGDVLSVVELAFTRDLITGGEDGSIRRWHNGKPGKPVVGDEKNMKDPVMSLVELQDDVLISGSANGILKIWHIDEYSLKRVGRPIQTSKDLFMPSLMNLKNGDLIGGMNDGNLQRWRFNKDKDALEPIPTPIPTDNKRTKDSSAVQSLVELKHHDRIISGHANGNLHIWRMDKDYLKHVGDPIPTHRKDTNKYDQTNSNVDKMQVIRLMELENGDLVSGSAAGGMLQIWRMNKNKDKLDLIGTPLKFNSTETAVTDLLELTNGELITANAGGIIHRWGRPALSLFSTYKLLGIPIETRRGKSVARLLWLNNDEQLFASGRETFSLWPSKKSIVKEACKLHNSGIRSHVPDMQAKLLQENDALRLATNYCNPRTWKSRLWDAWTLTKTPINTWLGPLL